MKNNLYYLQTKQESMKNLTDLLNSILDSRIPMQLTLNFDGKGSYREEGKITGNALRKLLVKK